MSLAGILGASSILRLLGASAEVIEQGTLFMQIMLGSNGVIVFLFLERSFAVRVMPLLLCVS